MNRLYKYTVLYHSYLQCTSLSGHVPGSSLKSKWIRKTEYVLCPHRTEVFNKQTAFHNFYPIPSYIQRKKRSWIFFPSSLPTVFERKFLSVVFFIFKIFLRIWQRVIMSSLNRIFQYFQRCFPFMVCVQGVQFFAHFFLVVVLLHKLIVQKMLFNGFLY